MTRPGGSGGFCAEASTEALLILCPALSNAHESAYLAVLDQAFDALSYEIAPAF